MTKHQITTILENGKYVGLVTKNGEIVFKTEPKETPNEASALMTKYIQDYGNAASVKSHTMRPRTYTTALQVKHVPPSNPVPSPNSSLTPAANPTPRKCCGRR